mmetsp:Transcript_22095/g.67880  ORF Transcript_22095/g.67880 Transcript_22095/m.67880 type:complete len:270 (+) Transcript_22095:1202-2011(+)
MAGWFVRSASCGSPPASVPVRPLSDVCPWLRKVSIMRACDPRYSTLASTASGNWKSLSRGPSLNTACFTSARRKFSSAAGVSPTGAPPAPLPFTAMTGSARPKVADSSTKKPFVAAVAAGAGAAICEPKRSTSAAGAGAGAGAAMGAGAGAEGAAMMPRSSSKDVLFIPPFTTPGVALPTLAKLSRSSPERLLCCTAAASAAASPSPSAQTPSKRLCDPLSASTSSAPAPRVGATAGAASGDAAAVASGSGSGASSSRFMCMMLMNFSM